MQRLFLSIAVIVLVLSLLALFCHRSKAAGGKAFDGIDYEVVDPHLLDDVSNTIDDYTDRIIVEGHIDDLEYQAIVNEINERLTNEAKALLNDHERQQWRAVAEAIQNSDHDSARRLELVQNVIKYPLTSRLPATAAISVVGLANWQHARKIFLRMIK